MPFSNNLKAKLEAAERNWYIAGLEAARDTAQSLHSDYRGFAGAVYDANVERAIQALIDAKKGEP